MTFKHLLFVSVPTSVLCLTVAVSLSIGNDSPETTIVKAKTVAVPSPTENKVLDSPKVLGDMTVNGLATFYGDIVIKGFLQAGNVLYDIASGEGISVTNGQNPVITNTGVLSVQDQTGELTFTSGNGIAIDGLTFSNSGVTSLGGATGDLSFSAGNGIGVDGLTIINKGVTSLQGNTGDVHFAAGAGLSLNGLTFSNTDPGSGQSIFKTISAGSASFTATSNNDILTVVGGNGISVASNGTKKSITISANDAVLDLAGSSVTGLLPLSLGGTGASTAAGVRDILGLGTAALQNNSKFLQGENNLSDVANISTVRTNLGLGTAALQNTNAFLQTSNNLFDLTNQTAARTNLGLGSLATENTNTNALTNYLPLTGGKLTGDLTLTKNIVLTKSDGILISIPDSSYLRFGGASEFKPQVLVVGSNFSSWPGRIVTRFGSGGSQWEYTDGTTRVLKMQLNSSGVLQTDNISSLSTNANLSIVPNGTGYTIIGNAGTTSHSFNTNDDLFVSGRLEVDKQTYFDSHVRIGGASLCVNSTNAACVGTNPGTIYASNTTVQSADVAENYVSSQKLEPGDVVMPSNTSYQAVTKTTHEDQVQVIGIVSTKPGVTLNSEAKTDVTHPYLYPIALSGRVPVKVSKENGDISVGDLITTSSTQGVAMRASGHNAIIGKALESYSGDGVGKIMAFVTLSSSVTPANTFVKSDIPSIDIEKLQNDIVSLSSKFASLSDLLKLTDRVEKLESTIASSTAQQTRASISGDSVIPVGSTEATIEQSSITTNAKVFVTPTTLTDMPLAVISKSQGSSFTVAVPHPVSTEIRFDWWIVNQ